LPLVRRVSRAQDLRLFDRIKHVVVTPHFVSYYLFTVTNERLYSLGVQAVKKVLRNPPQGYTVIDFTMDDTDGRILAKDGEPVVIEVDGKPGVPEDARVKLDLGGVQVCVEPGSILPGDTYVGPEDVIAKAKVYEARGITHTDHNVRIAGAALILSTAMSEEMLEKLQELGEIPEEVHFGKVSYEEDVERIREERG